MKKIKEKLSQPFMQMIIFALIFSVSVVLIITTAMKDKERNTPDMTDPRADAVVTSVSSYTASDDSGEVSEHYNVTVDFSIDGELYSNVSVYNVPFQINIGDHLNIKYDAAQPSICSVVDDPEPHYSTLTYIFFSATAVFSVFAFALAVRRSKLQEIRENVAKKNATAEEIDRVKEGYGSYDGTGKANVDAAPFSDKIDYNQIYDENKGVMDSFYDPTAPYMGYDEENPSEQPNQDFYNPEAQYTDYQQPYTGYEQPNQDINNWDSVNPFYQDPDSTHNDF